MPTDDHIKPDTDTNDGTKYQFYYPKQYKNTEKILEEILAELKKLTNRREEFREEYVWIKERAVWEKIGRAFSVTIEEFIKLG